MSGALSSASRSGICRLMRRKQPAKALSCPPCHLRAHGRSQRFGRVERPRLVGISLDGAQADRANVTTELALYPSFLEHRRCRIACESAIRVPLTGRLSRNARLFDRSCSRQPFAVERNGYGVVSGFGVSFWRDAVAAQRGVLPIDLIPSDDKALQSCASTSLRHLAQKAAHGNVARRLRPISPVQSWHVP